MAALGTPGGVTSDEDHRLAIAGMTAAQTSTVAVRTGVMVGPGSTALVTGTSATGTMTVAVAPFHAISTRGAADGVYLGVLAAATTVTIAAAPASNSRIDVVYAKQNDSGSTISPDASTTYVVDKVTGTAAVSPTKPALPVGAVELATVTVAAGATSTNGAGVTIANTALPTVARGAPVPVRTQAERDALTAYDGLSVVRLDLGGSREDRISGAWVTPAAAATTRYRKTQRAIGTGTDTYTAPTMTTLLSDTWTSAPPGDYLIHSTLGLTGTNPGGNIEVRVNGALISEANTRADVDSAKVTVITNTHAYTHTSGNLAATVAHAVSVGTGTVYNATTRMIIEYLGRRT